MISEKGLRGLGSSAGRSHGVVVNVRQGILLSQFLSPPRNIKVYIYVQCKWVTAHGKGSLTPECRGVNCDRLTSNAGITSKPNLLVALYCRNYNRDKPFI